MNNTKGFTLIELMVVVSIIGILAAIAVPQFGKYRARAFRAEGYSLVSPIRYDIQDYVDATGVLPVDNAMAGLAKPEHIRGKYVEKIEVNQGVISITFNDSTANLNEFYIKLTPEILEDNPTGPILWQRENIIDDALVSDDDSGGNGKSKRMRKS